MSLGSSQVAASCTYLGSITIQVECSSLPWIHSHKFFLLSSSISISAPYFNFYSIMLSCSSIWPIVLVVLVFPFQLCTLFFFSIGSFALYCVYIRFNVLFLLSFQFPYSILVSYSVFCCVRRWHSCSWVWFIIWKALNCIDVSLSLLIVLHLVFF